MGRKLVLTGTKLTNLSAPRLATVDPIESAGSLLLMDATHPVASWTSDVPAHMDFLPNLLRDQAATVTGTSTELDSFIQYMGMSGTQGKLERSGKGGLHGIYSNTHATNIGTGNSCYVQLTPGNNIGVYLSRIYTTNHIYMSLWSRMTRDGAGGQVNAYVSYASTTSSTSNRRIMLANNASWSSGGAAYRDTALGNQFSNAWASTYNLAAEPNNRIPTSHSDLLDYVFQVGNYGTINGFSTAKNNVTSRIFYRAYIEDLTVSGRTYEEVTAIDKELYTKEVLTPGGRYYGDTFTDPATIP